MIQINLNNNKFRLTGNLKILNKVYEDMKVKHPNAWHLRSYMEPGWDGKIKYLTDAGYAKTGLLPLATSLIEKHGGQYSIIDKRNLLKFDAIPTSIGEFTPRDYQIEAVESIVYNYVDDLPFQRGIIGAATNAGKTLIAAMLYKSFKNAKALILVKSSDLYKQFLDDMPKMFGDDWGYMQGKKVKWANIMICMTPTLRNRLQEFSTKLASYNITLFDECHESTSKTNKKVLTALYNTSIRIGLSGTPLAHKDPTKNMDVRSFFGEVVYAIKNTELIEQGFSSPVIIKINKGNTKIKIKGNYAEEYRQGISTSKERTMVTLNRIDYYLRRGCKPILIVGKYHEHVENLYKYIKKRFGENYRIDYIHHKIKDRKLRLDSFKDGTIDILVASLIIKLGQNMPLIRAMINASAGDSQINALQLIGRALRKHRSKKKVYYEDFHDEGAYLRRHSKHRIEWYKKQGFKVIELYKKVLLINKKHGKQKKKKTGRNKS